MALTPHLHSLSDRALDRTLKIGIALLTILAIAFGGIYYLGQHPSSGPSLAERTITAAEAAVRAEPNDVGARMKLAAAYRLDGRDSDALAQYNEILAALPNDHTTLLARGDLLVSQGDLDEAIADFQQVVSSAKSGEFAGADTQLEQAYFSLGVAQLENGDASAAVPNLVSALQIDSADADAYYQLGVAELKLGHSKKAISAVRRALQFVPTGWCEPYETLGQAYGAMKLAPQADYAAAMLSLCKNDSAAATTQLTALLDGPVAVDAMLGLGMIAAQANDRDAAIEWFNKVLVADPTNVNAMYALSGMGAKVPKSTGSETTATSHPTTQRRAG